MSFSPDKYGGGVLQVSSPVVQFVPLEEDLPEYIEELESFQQHITRPYFSNFATLAVRVVGSRVVLAATDKFILASFQEQDQERTSVRFTFGDSVIYAGAGRRPKIYIYSGFLVDTEIQGSSISHWKSIYENHLRGTKCAKNKAVVELNFRDQYRLGYINSCSLAYDPTKPRIATFNFSMFVIKEE